MSYFGYRRRTTPSVDKWFRDSTVHSNTHATVGFTTPSVMSMLTGLYPWNHGVRFVFQTIDKTTLTLPDYLNARGYHTAGIISNMVLTQEATHLGERFDYYDDFVDTKVPVRDHYERTARSTTDAAVDWLEKARKIKQPHFVWLHYMDPHGPYSPPEDKPTHFSHDHPLKIDTDRIPRYNRLEGVNDGLSYIDRYDEEIAYTDREVGRFLKAYNRAGLLEDAVVIFTSDHGEYMMDHEKWFSHGYHLYEETTRVPLMIKYPGKSRRVLDTPVSLIDLVPTILDLAGYEKIPKLDGRSLQETSPRDLFLEGYSTEKGQYYLALIGGSKKWVAFTENGQENLKGRVFFDLKKDPKELEPIPYGNNIPIPLMKILEQFPYPPVLSPQIIKGFKLVGPKERPSGGLPVVPPGIDEETEKRLRALGYIQ